ncbi:putative Tyrosinase central domain-containing protein [Seiridium cardinale]
MNVDIRVTNHYWSWDRYAADPIHSPIFGGSETSMSGNGLYFASSGLQLPLYPPPYVIPPSEAGYCVTTDPFANMGVDLARCSRLARCPANPQTDGLGYNHRGLKRDVNVYTARETTTNYTENLIANSNNVYWFQTIMNGRAEIANGAYIRLAISQLAAIRAATSLLYREAQRSSCIMRKLTASTGYGSCRIWRTG